MIRLGVPKAELGPVGISNQKMIVEKRTKSGGYNGKINEKLYQLMKDERYTDVTLKFDDGKRMSCHRCVLASSSDYFDCMFSNGMRESNEDVIEVVGVTSALMASALEFIYTGQCECVFEDFFDLLLVANMYELREFELALVDRVVILDRDRGSFLERGTKTRAELEEEILDFLVEAWVFCRRYPVIASSLKASLTTDSKNETLFKDYIIKSLGGAPRCNWSSHLPRSKNLMSLDFESFRDFLTDSFVTDHNPKLAFDMASAWLMHQPSPKGPSVSDEDVAVDMETSSCAEPESRLSHFEVMMGDLRLRSISKLETVQTWGADIALSDYPDRVESMRQAMNKWNLLVMTVPDGDGCVKFICHDMEAGVNYRLDPPTYDFPESDLFGTPKLMIQDKSPGFCKDIIHSLYCIRGVRQKGKDLDPQDEQLSFIRHEYSFTRKQWFLCPEKKSSGTRAAEEEAPLNLVEFLVPHYLPSDEKRIPLVRLSHDYEKEPKPEEASTEKIDLVTPPPLLEKPVVDKSDDAEEKGPKDVYTDKPAGNIAELYSSEIDLPGFSVNEKNHWQCRIPNFEVLGFGVYKKKNQSSTGVALFGNSYAKEGLDRKETLVLQNAVRKRSGFPEGVCESPLSVVSESDYIFIVPSSPYVALSKKGKRTIRLPKVYVFNPHGRFSETQDWVSLPTPTCPDLDYAALYYDLSERRICLVLVQKPSCKAPFAEVFKSASNTTLDPIETRSKQSQRGRGGKRKTAATKKKASPVVEGRVVGRYQLLLGGYECFASKKKRNLTDIWKPLEVSNATANFFALGSMTQGEVRILSTSLNVNNLTKTQINLIDGAQHVGTTDGKEEGTSLSASSRPDAWVNHQCSIYQDSSHNQIECKVNLVGTQQKLLPSIKPRKLEHAMMNETPLKPSHPTIKFKITEAYSMESLYRDSYEYSDDDDDDYSSSVSDYFRRGALGDLLGYDGYGYDSDVEYESGAFLW